FYIGATSKTAIYSPSGNNSPGSWAAGSVIPGGLGAADAGAAMMVNGKILCAVSPGFNTPPVSFLEYDYAANSFTQVSGPTGASDNIPSYEAVMLDLPDGNVLYSHFGSDLYVYTPDSTPLAAGQPVINNITANTDGSFTLTGTGLNGISAGAAYGDDAQMDSNYPLVRFTDGSGNVHYGRTFNWNSTGVMTGNNIVSTKFTPPSNLPAGSSFVVVANGIASDSVLFYPSDSPTVNFAFRPPGAEMSDASAQIINGTAADIAAAIGAVRVALNRSSDGAWYDFVDGTWGTTNFDFNHDILTAGGTSTWSAQMPALSDGNYTV